MFLSHLHPLRRYAPDGALEVKLRPLGPAELTGAYERVCDEHKRAASDGATVVGPHLRDQVAELLRLRHGREVPSLVSLEGTSERRGWVSVGSASRDRIPEDERGPHAYLAESGERTPTL